jgi:hypothetical protein
LVLPAENRAALDRSIDTSTEANVGIEGPASFTLAKSPSRRNLALLPASRVCWGESRNKDYAHAKVKGGPAMRVMIKFAFPVDAGNDAIRTGKMEKVSRLSP